MKRRLTLLLLCWSCSALFVFGQGEAFDDVFYKTDQPEEGNFVKEFLVHHDNDLFSNLVSNQDEAYTGGFLLRFTTRSFLVKPFIHFNPDSSKNILPRNYQTIGLGGLGFTPFNLSAKEVLTDDRPYGSFTFGELGLISDVEYTSLRDIKIERYSRRIGHKRLQNLECKPESKAYARKLKRINKMETKAARFEHPFFYNRIHKVFRNSYRVGVIGGDAVPVFQAASHRLFPRETPNGWHNQIGAGKKHLAVNYNFHYQQIIQNRMLKHYRGLVFDKNYWSYFTPSYFLDINVGNFMNTVGAGFEFNLISLNTTEVLEDMQKMHQYDFEEKSTAVNELLHEYDRDTVNLYMLIDPGLLKRALFRLYKYGEDEQILVDHLVGVAHKKMNLVGDINSTDDDSIDRNRVNINTDEFSDYQISMDLFDWSQEKDRHKRRIKRMLKKVNKRIAEKPGGSKLKKLYAYRLVNEDEQSYTGLETDERFFRENSIKLSVYSRIWGRAIVYNSMLQGTFFNDESIHTIDYRNMNIIVVDSQFGVNVQLGKRVNAYAFLQARSKEFLGGKGIHWFGGIGMGGYLGK
jgi:hypothetical protein